ncbi:uncharacterized protein [Nicotiana sylvestris]|uniref:uncharacterized protein n=1 Tax=Nicotiana sylvestris TaxID=4096 RepID=UPI00388C7582
MQGNQEKYEQGSSGYNQDDRYYEQSEEVLYANNYQGQRGNAPNQQWRSQGNNQNLGNQGQGNWNNNNNSNNWGNNNQNWGNNRNWGGNNNQGGWNNGNQGNWEPGFQRPPMFQQPNNLPPFPSQSPSSSNNEMGWIESMFEQMMKKNADSDAELASHNTSIRNLEVQLGQISQALNTRPKKALPSDMVVNPKGGNNTGHAMAVTTRSGRGGEASTSKQKEVVSDDVEVQNEDDPIIVEQVSEEKLDGEARIDIHDNEKETRNDVNPSREHVIDIPETVMPNVKAPLPRPSPPYPQKLAKQKNENQLKKFIEMMKRLSINIPLVEALEQMPGYAKFMKDLVTKKRSMDCETIKMSHQMSAIVNSMATKLENPNAYSIPCTIGSAGFAKALCDLGASINLMPYSVFKMLGIGQLRASSMRLQMADRIMKRPFGIIDDVIVRVDKFILPTDFMILDCEVNYEVPIILGRPFLATGKALVDVEAGERSLTLPMIPGKAKFILFMTDYFSKWMEAHAFEKVLEKKVIDFIWDHILCRFGIPAEIVCDNGKQFIGSKVTEFFEAHKIKRILSTPYHLIGNGQVESTNKTIIQNLKKRLDDTKGKWREVYPRFFGHIGQHRSLARGPPHFL